MSAFLAWSRQQLPAYACCTRSGCPWSDSKPGLEDRAVDHATSNGHQIQVVRTHITIVGPMPELRMPAGVPWPEVTT